MSKIARGPRSKYKITQKLLDDVERLAAQGLTVDQIAHCIGWCKDTLFRKKKIYKELQDAIARGNAQGVKEVTNSLFENAKDGNLGAQVFYLKNRGGWRDTVNNEITGKDGGAIETDNKWTIEIVGID